MQYTCSTGAESRKTLLSSALGCWFRQIPASSPPRVDAGDPRLHEPSQNHPAPLTSHSSPSYSAWACRPTARSPFRCGPAHASVPQFPSGHALPQPSTRTLLSPSCSARYRCSARVALLALARALSRPICLPRSRSSQPEVKRTQKTVSTILFAKESLLSFKINPQSITSQN